METVYLKTLVEAIATGSLSKAADSLCITPSTASRRIKFMEDHYGYSLLDRSGSKLVLTNAGKIVMDTLLTDCDTSLHLRPTVYLKFPTADASKGLGTGKFDFGAGVEVSKWLGNWQPFAEGRYIVQGASHDETGAENFITADAGVAYSWNDRLVTSAYARFGTALFSDMSAPLEARLKMVWRFGDRMYTDVFALKGLSDGSPDYGGGASVFFEF